MATTLRDLAVDLITVAEVLFVCVQKPGAIRLRRGLDRLFRRVDVGRVLDDNIAQGHNLDGTTHRTLPRRGPRAR